MNFYFKNDTPDLVQTIPEKTKSKRVLKKDCQVVSYTRLLRTRTLAAG